MEEKLIPKKLDKAKDNYQIPSCGNWGEWESRQRVYLHQKKVNNLSA